MYSGLVRYDLLLYTCHNHMYNYIYTIGPFENNIMIVVLTDIGLFVILQGILTLFVLMNYI